MKVVFNFILVDLQKWNVNNIMNLMGFTSVLAFPKDSFFILWKLFSLYVYVEICFMLEKEIYICIKATTT